MCVQVQEIEPLSILMSSIYPLYVLQQLFPAENVRVSFHQHPLRLKDAHEIPYHCVGCKEKALGKFYRCEDAENCDFHLHLRCYDLSEMGLTSSIAFPFLKSKKCEFEFHKGAPGGDTRVCDACGKEVGGWFFRCSKCKKPHHLHPCCASLPIKQKGENGIVLHLEAKTSSKCQLCESECVSQGIRGWVYFSNCGKRCYHVRCVMDMIQENLKQGFYGDRRLIKETTDERESCGRAGELTRVQSGAIRNRSAKGVRKKLLIKKATMIVLNVVNSAIIGVPITSACTAFYELF